MAQPGLARRLGTADAVVIGLGSMIGAGVFAAFSPAAQAAGAGLFIGLGIAAVVAYCNATASAQLAAQYPTSGGTYIYGRERLGHWWGFFAGWGFIVGKTASCAAMALTFAAYAVPGSERPVAIAAVVALAAVNSRGVTRTARLTRVIVAVVLASLALVVTACLLGGIGSDGRGAAVAAWDLLEGGWYGTLQSAGLLFFAFAGYARIATMGEEVRDPERTIPRAILIALAITVTVYAGVAASALLALGASGVADTPAPLVTAVDAVGRDWATAFVRVGATAAALGALLALMAGVGRTTLAMARHNDLPNWLAAVHPRYRVPHHAEIALAAVVCIVILVADLREAIGFSSFGVLLYYSIANLAAFTQPSDRRRFPRPLQVLGVAGCAILAVTLPLTSILIGFAVFATGIAYRAWRLRSALPAT